jgi:hypothetical protein
MVRPLKQRDPGNMALAEHGNGHSNTAMANRKPADQRWNRPENRAFSKSLHDRNLLNSLFMIKLW